MANFYDLKFRDENAVVADLLSVTHSAKLDSKRIEQQATVFVETIRKCANRH